MNEFVKLLSSASPDILLDLIDALREALDELDLLDDYHRAWCKRVERNLRDCSLAEAA